MPSSVRVVKKPEPVKLVYLCGPIDAAKDSTTGWRKLAASLLLANGISCFNPHAAFSWSGVSGIGSKIKHINLVALATCDALLAYLPLDILTVGSILEINRAVELGIRVAVVTEAKMVYLENVPTFTTTDQAIEYLTAQ